MNDFNIKDIGGSVLPDGAMDILIAEAKNKQRRRRSTGILFASFFILIELVLWLYITLINNSFDLPNGAYQLAQKLEYGLAFLCALSLIMMSRYRSHRRLPIIILIIWLGISIAIFPISIIKGKVNSLLKDAQNIYS